jgi:hypothetical protein
MAIELHYMQDGTVIEDTVTGIQYKLVTLDPTGTGAIPLPTGAASAALQTSGNASLTTIAAKDFATQTTLAPVLAKIIAAPATEANQTALKKAVGFKYVAGSSLTLTCGDANANTTQADLVVGDFYDLTNLSSTAIIYCGSATQATAANRALCLPPYATKRYEIVGTTLNFLGTVTGAGLHISKVDLS